MNEVQHAPQKLIFCWEICSTERSEAFEIELGAVQALKQQLEEGVVRNTTLRAALESQLKLAADSNNSSSSNQRDQQDGANTNSEHFYSSARRCVHLQSAAVKFAVPT